VRLTNGTQSQNGNGNDQTCRAISKKKPPQYLNLKLTKAATSQQPALESSKVYQSKLMPDEPKIGLAAKTKDLGNEREVRFLTATVQIAVHLVSCSSAACEALPMPLSPI